MTDYHPPYTTTPEILNRAATISEAIGRLTMLADQARALRIRQYEDFFNVSGMGTPDDLEEFSACQRGYLGENLPWSDLSRGALRWVDGADEHAQHAGFSPRLSGVKSEDEALYIAHHHHWQTLMLAAIEQEQQRYDQSITQRVEVA